jgi:hypothetical protein
MNLPWPHERFNRHELLAFAATLQSTSAGQFVAYRRVAEIAENSGRLYFADRALCANKCWLNLLVTSFSVLTSLRTPRLCGE